MSLHPLLWVLIMGAIFAGLTILISLLMSVSVAFAGRRYGDKLQSTYQQQLRALLPGKDCGACGCENCDSYARAVLFGIEGESACPYADEGVPEKLLALVAEMQKRMEDPKPPKNFKKRAQTIWEKKL